VTYNTAIDFENPDGKLLPGETAYATIPTGQVADATRVPNSAIRFTPALSAEELKRVYQQNGTSLAAAASRSGAAKVVWQIGPAGVSNRFPFVSASRTTPSRRSYPVTSQLATGSSAERPSAGRADRQRRRDSARQGSRPMSLIAVFRLALQALARNKLRSVLTLLGVIIGIGAVTCSVAVGEGASNQIQQQISNLGDNMVWIAADRLASSSSSRRSIPSSNKYSRNARRK